MTARTDARDDPAVSSALGPPLTGTRVVEVANYVAGPYAGVLLADLDADVVKVEEREHGGSTRFLSCTNSVTATRQLASYGRKG